MYYNTDANGYVANYALLGGVENGSEYAGALPEGFSGCPQAYHIVNGLLVLDATRRDEILAAQTVADAPAEDPTAVLEQRIAELEAVIDALVGGESA